MEVEEKTELETERLCETSQSAPDKDARELYGFGFPRPNGTDIRCSIQIRKDEDLVLIGIADTFNNNYLSLKMTKLEVKKFGENLSSLIH